MTFYLAMVFAALVVEALFQSLGWVPTELHTAVVDAAITFNYTTVLDIIFGIVFIVLGIVFFRTGGPEMMRMVEGGEPEHGGHENQGSHDQARHQHHDNSK